MNGSELEAAVDSGVITPDIARRLRNFTAERHGAPLADDERFGLVGGLADVMTALALVLLLGGLSAVLLLVGPLDAPLIMAACWGLAEHFTRRRKLTLTSFALFGAFAIAAACGLLALAMLTFPNRGIDLTGASAQLALAPVAALFVAAGTTLACALYWLRFKLPIAYMVTAVAAVNFFVQVMRLALPHASAAFVSVLLLLVGVLLLLTALWWDMSDVRRETRRADIAFWLHWAAGYQVAHASFRLLLGVRGHATGWDRLYAFAPMPAQGGTMIAVIALFGLFGLLALIIDRRSLLLSSLAFILPGTASLASANPLAGGVLAALFGGAALLLLATFWTPARRIVLSLLPAAFAAQFPRTDLTYDRVRPVA